MVTDGYYPESEAGVPLSRSGPRVTLQTRGYRGYETSLDRNQGNALGVEMFSRNVAGAGATKLRGANQHGLGVSQQRLV